VRTIQRVARNTGVLFISQASSYVIMFFYIIYVARYLGVEGFGILTFALAFTGIFGIIANLGLNQYLVREVSRDKSLIEKYLNNIISIKIILSIITLVSSIIIINLLNYPQQTILVVYFIVLFVIINSFSSIYYAVFQIYEKMEYQSIGIFLSSFLIFIFTLIVIKYDLGIVALASIYLIVAIITLALNAIICKWKFVSTGIYFETSFWRLILIETIFFGLAGIFTEIYFNIDSVMLSLIVGNEAVGWYNAAYRIIFVLLYIPSVFIVSVFPLMSKRFKSAKDLLKLEYVQMFRYMLISAIFLAIYGIIFSSEIINLIYGKGYDPSINALKVLMIVIPIIFLTYLFGNLLAAIDKQRLVTLITGISAIINVALNLVLIPKYSFLGASVATVITEGIIFIIMFTYISRYFTKISITQHLLMPLIGGTIVAFLIYLITQINWIIAAILGILLYFIVLYLLRVITINDIKTFKQIFEK
jgi:O-antigen/teichoic acid export membrane protein